MGKSNLLLFRTQDLRTSQFAVTNTVRPLQRRMLQTWRLIELPVFKTLVKTTESLVKSILISTYDGDPDENQRYSRVIANAVKHFQKYDPDAYYLATNAPRSSAYIRV